MKNYIILFFILLLLGCHGFAVKKDKKYTKSFYVELPSVDNEHFIRSLLEMQFAAIKVCSEEGIERELDFENTIIGLQGNEAFVHYSCREKKKYEFNEPIPMVKLSGLYPRKALLMGSSGYCDLKFDVDVRGIPVNVEIIKCAPKGHFEAASIMATENTIYIPRYENGVPQPTFGLKRKFEFKLR